MATYRIDESTLIAIADAVRNKTGSTDALNLVQMTEDISGLGVRIATGSFTFSEDTTQQRVTIEHNLGVIPNLFILRSDDVEIISGKRYLKGWGLFCPNIENTDTYFDNVCYMTGTTSTKWYRHSTSNDQSNGGYLLTSTNSGQQCKVSGVTENSATFGTSPANVYTYYQAGKTYQWIAGVVEVV